MSAPAIQITAPPAVPPVVTPRKGIAVALLLSLGLHAIVILALIDWFKDSPESPSIIRATLAHAGEPATVPKPPASTIHNVGPFVQPPPDARGAETDTAAETPQRPGADAIVNVVGTDDVPEPPGRSLDYAAAVRQIADLDASSAGAQPRIRRIVDGRTETAEDDWYFESWRRKVERIGKLNYPEQARAQKIYGSLQLLVAIEPDGSLRDVRVIDSSGHKVLDEAAVRIVQLASPYAPFPPGMRKDTDVLEIVRTWQFRKRGPASPS